MKNLFRNLCLLCFVFVACLKTTAIGSSEEGDMSDTSDRSGTFLGSMGEGSDDDRISLGDESEFAKAVSRRIVMKDGKIIDDSNV